MGFSKRLASAALVSLLSSASTVGLLTATQSFAGPNFAPTVLGTSFNYQGQLIADAPVNATCNFQFGLYDSLSNGSQIGSTVNASAAVKNGVFSTPLDFGSAAFTGEPRWLQMSVKCPADPSFVTMTPRQELSPTPYSLWSKSAGSIQGMPVSVSVPTTGQGLVWDGAQWTPGSVTGPAGPSGPMGPQGLIGPQGIPGPMGLTGPQGITGTQGITGLQGIQGIQGPAGQVGYCFLNNSSAAVIAVVLGGTYIPLPDNQSFGSGLCTINGSNTDITLSETGTYVISTNVIVTTDLLMSTQVLLNGIPLQPQFTPIVATDSYPLTVVINAIAGDIVSLQAFGFLGAVTLIGGNGASMTILKVA